MPIGHCFRVDLAPSLSNWRCSKVWYFLCQTTCLVLVSWLQFNIPSINFVCFIILLIHYLPGFIELSNRVSGQLSVIFGQFCHERECSLWMSSGNTLSPLDFIISLTHFYRNQTTWYVSSEPGMHYDSWSCWGCRWWQLESPPLPCNSRLYLSQSGIPKSRPQSINKVMLQFVVL